MATLTEKTTLILSNLKAINREIGRASGASLPGPRRAGAGRTGIDRPTALALGSIGRGVKRIESALRPTAADQRSLP